MRTDELLDAIGEARDEYIRDVREEKTKKIPGWVKWTSVIAACLVAALGINLFFGRIGGSAGAGSGGDTDLVYMAYAGPVLPLTVRGDSSGITVKRNINYDFSPYISYQESYGEGDDIRYYDRYDTESNITDSYVLKNTSGEDRTLTLLYPFVGNMIQWEYYPSVLVDGAPVDAALNPGPYSGGFKGVWGGEDQETGSVNIQALDSFAGYQTLLATEAYREAAFDPFPRLDQKAYVYRLHDYVYSKTTADVNPTLSMSFYIDYEKTHVLSYGMNGVSWNNETGYCSRRKSGIEYRPNVAPERQHPEDGYVILLGEDLESYTLQGYRDGGCEEGEELSDVGCTVTRYETTLGEILGQLLEASVREVVLQGGDRDPAENMPGPEQYFGLAAELLCTYGIIGDSPKERYDIGRLEDIFSGVYSDSRIIYLSFAVTVPAGGHITVEALQTKDASVDYYGKDKDKDGYDLATRLGSQLVFTEQTASVSGFDEIEILRQNFGFDLSGGITSVVLDMSREHYWMEIRKVK